MAVPKSKKFRNSVFRIFWKFSGIFLSFNALFNTGFMKTKNGYSLLLSLFICLVTGFSATAQIITTIAGGLGNGGMATAVAQMSYPCSIVFDAAGNLYIGDRDNYCVRKVSPTGLHTIVAGIGEPGDSGDGGPGSAAKISCASHIAVDPSGNLYISECDSFRVRKVSTAGVITTIAGTGVGGYSGDGAAATLAQISPLGIATDAAGNLYIACSGSGRVRMVNTSGIISTIAGIGSAGFSGDGAAATLAQLNDPEDVAVDASGNVYVADKYNYRIRKINTSGIISTVAGIGTAGYSGDGAAATLAKIDDPWGVYVDGSGNLYIADGANYRVRKVSAAGIIQTIAGNGSGGYTSDGIPATTAGMSALDCAVDASGNLFIADAYNNRIRKVDMSTGVITTAAGPGNCGGDGGMASIATLWEPSASTTDAAGNTYIADRLNHRIRKIDAAGVITTIAGTGTAGYGGDGGMASAAQLRQPTAVTTDLAGNIYVAELGNNDIRKINTSGIISSIAGNGTASYGGDGGMASAAGLNKPNGIKTDAAGNLYIADMMNNRIRKVDTAGIITTIVGTGAAGYGGDGGMASGASLNTPTGIALDGAGNLYISDSSNHCIRMVTPSGSISRIAGGGGTAGYGGDGGMASAALMRAPAGVAVDPDGTIFIADYGNNCIRKINSAGIISTIAGNGTSSYGGDGGMASGAAFTAFRVSVDNAGNLYIADGSHNRIRKVHYGLLGIPEVSKHAASSIDVYPNPAHTSFSVEVPGKWMDCTITMTDALGRIVLTKEAKKSLSATVVVPVNELPMGSYYVRFRTENDSYYSVLEVIK